MKPDECDCHKKKLLNVETKFISELQYQDDHGKSLNLKNCALV